LIRLEKTDTILILGKRGIGKTTLAKTLIDMNGQLNYLIIDILGNYSQYKNKYKVLNISPLETSKFDRALIFAMDKQMFTVLDEVDRFDYDSYLSYYVNIGRNYGTGWIAIARRPANLSKDFVTNADYTFLAKTTQRRDVEFITHSYDVSVDELANLQEHEFLLFKHDDLLRKVIIKI